MSCHSGPNFTKESLQIYLDVANIKSYPGSGSTVFDIYENQTNAILTAGVDILTDNKGCLYFNSSGELGNATGVLTAAINTTWEVYVNCEASINMYNMFMGSYPPYYCFHAGNRFFFSIVTGGIQRTISSPTNKILGQWYHTAVTVNYNNTDTTLKMYTNGVEDASVVVAGMPSYNGSVTIGEGRSTAWYPFKGKMGPARVYSSTLSAAEIYKNFQATRGRFGI